MGVMIESHLVEGKKLSNLQPMISLLIISTIQDDKISQAKDLTD